MAVLDLDSGLHLTGAMEFPTGRHTESTKQNRPKVVGHRDIRATLILAAVMFPALLAVIHAQTGLVAGLGALMAYEPATILISGSLLLAVGGALRRYDF